MKILQKRNCNLKATDCNGFNAVHLAGINGHIDILEYLVGLIPEKFN